MVLFEATRTSALQVKLPLTLMVWAAVVNAARLVTVTVGPPAPPAVPPPWAAHPTSPPVGGGGAVVGAT
jgi:hypothetical protein